MNPFGAWKGSHIRRHVFVYAKILLLHTFPDLSPKRAKERQWTPESFFVIYTTEANITSWPIQTKKWFIANYDCITGETTIFNSVQIWQENYKESSISRRFEKSAFAKRTIRLECSNTQYEKVITSVRTSLGLVHPGKA